jgi:hypothetical protein
MKILFVIIVLLISGCYSEMQNISSNQLWEGKWYGNGNKESVLSIVKKENDTYAIHFRYNENEWEGLGFVMENEMIIIFRYKNVADKGYFTLKLENKNKCTFTSYNSDGSYRSNGIVTK